MRSGMEFILRGRIVLQARVEDVWLSLLDSDTLASCFPGAENVDRIDEKTYKGVVKQTVGPVSGRFEFSSTLTEMEPPRYLKSVGRAADNGIIGTVTLETTLILNEVAEQEVELSYDAKLNVFGGLPIIGRLIMETKAKSLEKQFTENLRKKLSLEGRS